MRISRIKLQWSRALLSWIGATSSCSLTPPYATRSSKDRIMSFDINKEMAEKLRRAYIRGKSRLCSRLRNHALRCRLSSVADYTLGVANLQQSLHDRALISSDCYHKMLNHCCEILFRAGYCISFDDVRRRWSIV